MSKLWAGRIQAETNQMVNDFNESLTVDKRLYRQDIQGSLAHSAMLAEVGIISAEDAAAIKNGLEGILADIENGKDLFSPDNEDIHMNVESILTERIGEPGRRLHTARSRNDQVATDMKLYVKEEILQIRDLVVGFQKVLVDMAEENVNTVMPSYTHLQRAQPVTLGHYLMAYAEMLVRDVTRLEDCHKRMDTCPLGAGALAGTTYPIDRNKTAAALGFAGVAPNSLDAVADRDFCLELLSALAILMTHLSRLAEEIIMWCSMEFQFVELDEAFATGSSIMPQKKNPDVAELVRGKTGRVYGSLMALLTIMKGLSLAYNKDMQEDKEPVFDAIDTVKICLEVFAPMVATLTFRKENMRLAAAKGFLNATDCADYLVKKGMAFRDAYGVVGRLVRAAVEKNTTLEDLPIEDLKAVSELFEDDVYEAIKLENCVNLRRSEGGPAPEAVLRHVGLVRGFVGERANNPPERTKK